MAALVPGGALLLLTLCFPAAPALAAARVGGVVTVAGTLDDDLYAAGREVRIDGAIDGHVMLAGGEVAILGDVTGDALVAGGRVTVAGGVGDDLRAAGSEVVLQGFVTDQAIVAAGRITLEPGSAVGGRTWLAAGSVFVGGDVGADLRVRAGSLVLGGRVAGNVEVMAREIRLEPGTVILGDLIWRGPAAPVIAPEAQIYGEVRALGPARQAEIRGEGRLLPRWPLVLGLYVAGVGLLWLAPALVSRGAAVWRRAPVATALTGFLSLLLAPLLGVLLIATVLGWLLGLLVLAGWGFALLFAGLFGLVLAAELLAGSRAGGWRRAGLLLLVTVGFVALQAVPVAGTVIAVLLLCGGLGAAVRLLRDEPRLPVPASG